MNNFSKFATFAMLAAMAVSAQAQIDQITGQTTGPNGFASQDFEAAFNQYDIAALDDFSIAGPRIVTMLEADTIGWNGFANYANIRNYRVEIYTSIAAAAANLNGTYRQVVARGLATDPGAASQGRVSVPVNIVIPNAGTYWVALMAEVDFGTSGQFGIMQSTGGTPGGANAWQANPGGGFGQGTSFQIMLGGAPQNLAYRMTSQPVPEPATMAALGLGAAALIRRRRRSK
mgnify:CR=1 FL=1